MLYVMSHSTQLPTAPFFVPSYIAPPLSLCPIWLDDSENKFTGSNKFALLVNITTLMSYFHYSSSWIHLDYCYYHSRPRT